jgi:hypothetical protein
MVKKKGSLNLSINAIVVLILAITILGLGLGFIKQQFDLAQKKFDVTDQQLVSDMIDDMEASGKKLTFKQAKFEIKSGEKKEYYVAIRNTGDTEARFWLHWVCQQRIDQNAGFACNNQQMLDTKQNWVWFNTYDYLQIPPGESEAFIVEVQPAGTSNTYMGKLKVYQTATTVTTQQFANMNNPPQNTIDYDEQDFYLNVI